MEERLSGPENKLVDRKAKIKGILGKRKRYKHKNCIAAMQKPVIISLICLITPF